MFDTQSYVQRISYNSELLPTAETLRTIHLAHMRSVPFENLDIHLKRPIELNLNAFFRKIVQENRGGFCYELNGLFAELLKSLGFSVTMLSARAARPDGGFGPDFDHMTLLVDLDERWIADVGFGESFVEPLLLDKSEEQLQYGKRYRIIPKGMLFFINLLQMAGGPINTHFSLLRTNSKITSACVLIIKRLENRHSPKKLFVRVQQRMEG